MPITSSIVISAAFRGVSLVNTRVPSQLRIPVVVRSPLSKPCICWWTALSFSRRRYSSVTSLTTSAIPKIALSLPRMGTAESAIWCAVPPLASSMVWLLRSAVSPLLSTLPNRSSMGSRVLASLRGSSVLSGMPLADRKDIAVSCSAIGFMCVTKPSSSVMMTASPTLLRVADNSCSR